jgi:hypothetical protein
MYNCAEPWQSFFGSTTAHNTVVVDNSDQMQRVSRFVWFHWTKAKLLSHKSLDNGIGTMQGEHYGYCRGKEKIIHRRAVLLLPDNCWMVVDDVLGMGIHEVGLCWQLSEAKFKLKENFLIMDMNNGPACAVIFNSAGAKCRYFEGDDEPPGWRSLYYGNHKPSPTLICSGRVNLPVRFVTLVNLADIIENAVLKETNSVSWISRASGQEFVVGLNSIEDSKKKTFVFAQHGSEKTFLD